MIDFPELPAFCRIPHDDRRQAWAGRELLPSSGAMVIGRTVVRDAGTEQVRIETEQALAARSERRKADKRDAEAIRRRGLKNERIIKRAAAGEIVLPQPIKIVRVVDLNQLGRKPATEETDVKKTAAKKTAPKRRKKAGPKAQPARKARAKKSSTSKARTPVDGKVDVVAKIAAMMSAPNGASMEEMVKATGIAAHPMRAKIKLVRDRLGYTTTAPSKANAHRYHAEPPKKKAEGS